MIIVNLILISFFSFLITYLTTPLVIKFAKRFSLLDDPQKRPHPAHTHSSSIPRAGGLAILCGILVPIIIFIPANTQIIAVSLSIIILTVIGLWDDRKDRSPYLRLISNFVAAGIVVSSGTIIPYFTNPLGGTIQLDKILINIPLFGYEIPILASLASLVWIVWLMNTIGWSGGVDGQLPGFVTISATVIGILSLRFVNTDPGQITVSMLSFITAGAFLGFLPWNYYPQKIMPGYGGKTLAGFMLAVLSILAFTKLGTALIVLAVPLADASYLLTKRVISGKSPVWASGEHLHHNMLYLGWSKRKVAHFYWLASLTLGFIALTLNPKQKIFAGVLIFTLILGFILWFNLMARELKKINPENL